VNLSPQQDAAVLAVSRWLKAGKPQVFRLFGYAGTGKTTLARRIAEEVDGDVLFASFTGKAAQVMRNKGCSNARTLHSLIYRPRGDKAEEETGTMQPAFSLNRTSTVAKAKLVVVDECSMVDEALGRDLLSFGTPVLVLGDPGQLPPVNAGQGGGGFFTEQEPDVMLTEIHRQARENPIIALAQTVREGGRPGLGRYGTSRVVSRGDIDAEQVLAADQILVGRNRTRQLYNRRIRCAQRLSRNIAGGPATSLCA
jgi:exodeoxyribonuclease-5